ncbi:DNA repair protein RecO [Acaryochloris thomasi RCC1774]|uniref:DNA repair protein RecO n=1 Tax=Acaryochloris thomasi RCC1774 TaxID=1764569 RepID=A0A2W1JKW8_9CYAN|nr:DNA repair protein RecO [Acaryochloris thomasi]PZD73836.1 DNA repair protein RecO [Acaryochloris thomasi RCC1774]
MSRVYKATGINLKSMALGEADRLLTILTRERGLVRAVAGGARKPKSKLGGRSSLFVVNNLVMSEGRSLDRLSQAETLVSYPGLSRDLAKLTVAQYWAELVLHQALSGQPQPELFDFLCDRLAELEQTDPDQIPVSLIEGIYQLLDWAGIAPQVNACCITQEPLIPNLSDPDWRVGFSPSSGGAVALSAWNQEQWQSKPVSKFVASDRRGPIRKARNREQTKLNAIELRLLQLLSQSIEQGGEAAAPSEAPLSPLSRQESIAVWMSLERALRHYVQYYFEQPIRSASLLETCFAPTVPRSVKS